MTSKKPVAVFGFTHPSLKDLVLRGAPPHFEVLFLDMKDESAAQRLLPRADFLVTIKLPKAYIPLLQNCKLVQAQGAGYDGIDSEGLAKVRIPFARTPEGTIVGAAEHTILLILALSKQLVRVHESVREGKYDEMAWRTNLHLLYRKTLGIVGLGRVGQRVSQLAGCFESNLIYYDAFRPPAAAERELGVAYAAFDELLAEADIISVHTALTSQTRGLFRAGEFARMKPGALFINTSRGETYDMDALYESLHSGHLGGAGLDVFNPEPPPPEHPILRLPNVICTSHISGGAVEAQQLRVEAQFDNFIRVLQGETPHNLVRLTTS